MSESVHYYLDIYKSTTDVEYDQVICNILSYLNSNISEDLNVDKIAMIFYLSKAHLMRKLVVLK